MTRLAVPEGDGSSGPQVVFIRLLEACGAGCIMCPFARSRDPFRVPLDRLLRLVNELAELGTRHLRFTGGEPTDYEPLVEAVAGARSAGIEVSFITNGSNLQARAPALVDAGLSGVVCSIDAPSATIHDSLRRTPGLFDAAIRGLRCLSELRSRRHQPLSLTVNTVVSRRTAPLLSEFPELLDSLGVDHWNLIPIKDKRSLFLSEAEIHGVNQQHAPKLDGRLETARVRLNVVDSRVLGTDGESIAGTAAGRLPTHPTCQVPLLAAYIDAKNGTMTACNCLPHRKEQPLTLSGVWERPFAELWHDAEYRARRVAFSAAAPRICTGCEPGNVRLNRDLSSASRGSVEWV